MKEAADEYRKIEDPTVEDRLKIRNKYGYRVVG